MTDSYRVVTPFAPFAPESITHQRLADFDWLGAIEMMRHSVQLSNNRSVVILTDDAHRTFFAGPLLSYATQSQRLMLWILEVCLRYITSNDFDRDTVMVSPDFLVFGSLGKWFSNDFDLAFLHRNQWHGVPRKEILNGVQFWCVRNKSRVIAFYEHVYELAQGLSESLIRWGADTRSIELALTPIVSGVSERWGARVKLIPHSRVVNLGLRPLNEVGNWRPDKLLDFKSYKKRNMRKYYEHFIQSRAVV